MIVDAHTLPDGTALDADLCIIGAGAAGIAMAREFIDTRYRVAVLESGAMEFEAATQELYEGTSVGRPYLDLEACRLRFFGGSTNHWGGWCAPLDAADFEPREGSPHRGWPFDRAHLDPFYARANAVCGVGPYTYAPTRFGIAPDQIAAPFTGPDFVDKILQIAHGSFSRYRQDIEKAAGVTVHLHANALDLVPSEDGGGIAELRFGTLAGARLTMRARAYVLATGGIENPRILLSSGPSGGKGIGNQRDLVGRFFMVHIEFNGGAIALSDPYVHLDFMSEFDKAKPWPFLAFVGPSDDALRRPHLSNVRFWGEFKFTRVIEAVEALRRLSGRTKSGAPVLHDVLEVARDIDGLAMFGMRKVLFGDGVPVEAVILRCHAEQQPNADSRVLLGDKRDALGVREVAVDWQLTPTDKANLIEVLSRLGAEVGRAGFGRLRSFLTPDETTWPEDMRGNEHHMGTTRMHDDPQFGVVDRNCRVHGIANLYVAGSSVFPTGGAANPTLTIVALALRLADHLKERLA